VTGDEYTGGMTVRVSKPRVDFWRILFGTLFVALAVFTIKDMFFGGPIINPERNITVWVERLAIAARLEHSLNQNLGLSIACNPSKDFVLGGLQFSRNRGLKSCSIQFQDPKNLEGTVLLEASNGREYGFLIPVAKP
jgi:hypothetical protein